MTLADDVRRTITGAAINLPNAPATSLLDPNGELHDLRVHGRLFWVGSDDNQSSVCIPHLTISAQQCAIEFAHDGRVMCTHSTKAKNPTRINGVSIVSGQLEFGAWLRLGNVELMVVANLSQLRDARALQIYNNAGGDDQRGSLAAAAKMLGVHRHTVTTMLERARAVDVLPPIQSRPGRRHRSRSEIIQGIAPLPGVPTHIDDEKS